MTETAFDDEDPVDEEDPLGDRQWGFGQLGAYVYTHRRRCAVLGAVGLTADTTRQLAARLMQAADAIEADTARGLLP